MAALVMHVGGVHEALGLDELGEEAAGHLLVQFRILVVHGDGRAQQIALQLRLWAVARDVALPYRRPAYLHHRGRPERRRVQRLLVVGCQQRPAPVVDDAHREDGLSGVVVVARG